MKYVAFAGFRHSHIFQLVDEIRAFEGAEIVGAWEEDPVVRNEHRDKFPEGFYESYEQLLSDERVDIVAIGDYYGIRGQRAIQALKAGKHVLCDKPVCTKLEELNEISALHEQTGLSVGCMLTLRDDPALKTAERLIREGQLGDIHAVTFTGQHPLNYGIRPMWYFEEGKHGGVFNDIAIHGIDAVKMMTGLSYDKTIAARQWNAFSKEKPEFLDCAQLMGTLENAAGLIADVSYAAPGKSAFQLPSYWRFTIWGEKGFIECKAGEVFILAAIGNDEKARRIEADQLKDTYLTRFLEELDHPENDFETQNVLDSTKRVLGIQAFSDGMNK